MACCTAFTIVIWPCRSLPPRASTATLSRESADGRWESGTAVNGTRIPAPVAPDVRCPAMRIPEFEDLSAVSRGTLAVELHLGTMGISGFTVGMGSPFW
ncbi:hypothetical protein GCM10023096_04000 [Nonomuraea ferruginea]